MENQQYPQQPQQFQQPPMQQTPPQNKSKGGMILCIISLICMFGIPSIEAFLLNIASSGDISDINNYFTTILGFLTGGSSVTAWVLVIIARVKYKNKFSKVLLIVYIIVTVLEILAVILLFVACISCTQSCNY